jgi:HicA toxin of bacterial toxin-antitoxin,
LGREVEDAQSVDCFGHLLSLYDCNFLKRRYHNSVDSRQKKTLAALFQEPTQANLVWLDIESLVLAVGCKRVEGSGSRVRFEKYTLVASFHRQHPAKEAKRYQIRDARDFLIKIGVSP